MAILSSSLFPIEHRRIILYNLTKLMANDLGKLFSDDRRAQFAAFLLIIVTFWWIILHPFTTSQAESLVFKKYIWGSFYQVIALWGAVCGLLISQYWGGGKSVFGRSVMAFSLGLLFQVFGQSVYSYYNLYAQIQAPYPSVGDIGFFGSIPPYIYGAYLLARVSGIKVSLKSFGKKIQAFLIPLVALVLSYIIFLKGYQFDFSQPIKIFLDFGYPLGQAIYVSIAILTLLLSREILGGIMRGPVILFLSALIFQYICDYNFLYQASRGTWLVGGYGDYLYASSYFLMTTALLYVGVTFSKIRNVS